jgi:hypothetical protein
MLSVLSVDTQNVANKSIMLSVIMLNVIMLKVNRQSAVAQNPTRLC